jgi:hypothetical protein
MLMENEKSKPQEAQPSDLSRGEQHHEARRAAPHPAGSRVTVWRYPCRKRLCHTKQIH